MTGIETIAAALILANLVLLARRSVSNFAFALAGVTLYAWIFWQAKLYSDALLQGFFFALNLYGWWSWSAVKAAQGDVVVERMTPQARALTLAVIAAATGGWGWLMHRFTDAAAPWLDAGVAMTSVAAQILLTRRKIENWVLWIAVNMMSILLYFSRGLDVTGLLYCAMLALSVWSLVAWRRA
jgi:nicotinamide mononucleotide transporter